jgi:hypothetical protein
LRYCCRASRFSGVYCVPMMKPAIELRAPPAARSASNSHDAVTYRATDRNAIIPSTPIVRALSCSCLFGNELNSMVITKGCGKELP